MGLRHEKRARDVPPHGEGITAGEKLGSHQEACLETPVQYIRKFLTRILAVAPLVPPGHRATKPVSCGETPMVWGSCLTILPAMGSELCRVSRRRDRRVASDMFSRKVRLPRQENMVRLG
jgi:hypothetical protein